jgi:hypothetical protein
MIDLKKKCWREKVTAELTMAHVVQFAQKMGTNMSTAEVAEFLNHNGTAQNVWIHMMQAGEQYIKSSIKTKGVNLEAVSRPRIQAAMVQ